MLRSPPQRGQGLARALIVCMGCPAQVIKNRLQAQTLQTTQRYAGVWDAVVRILQTEGAGGLYKGMQVKVCRRARRGVAGRLPAPPLGAACLAAREETRDAPGRAARPCEVSAPPPPLLLRLQLVQTVLAAALLMSLKEEVYNATKAVLHPGPAAITAAAAAAAAQPARSVRG
jgi:adenine nucleotide transporter 17